MTITINLTDVVRHGSIEKALSAWADEHNVAYGQIGPKFSSCPGSVIMHNANDYAQRAIAEGASQYLDIESGRMALRCGDDYDPDDDDDHVFWTTDSVVRFEVPTAEEALAYPKELGMLAEAFLELHSPESDVTGWDKLKAAIRTAADAIDCPY